LPTRFNVRAMKPLPATVKKKFVTLGPSCALVDRDIETVDDFLQTVTGAYWFRGHGNFEWQLTPSALRYKRAEHRRRALNLFREFRKIATADMPAVTTAAEKLGWMVRAQHYGVPTRLLDWTEKPAIALYFACVDAATDGAIFLMDPAQMNQLAVPLHPRIIFPDDSAPIVEPYAELGPLLSAAGLRTIAVSPNWDNPRIKAQGGTFTLHGERRFALDSSQCPSLAVVPIRKKHKNRLLKALEAFAINELTVYPELSRIAKIIKQRANLA
jgi:hypothetical protein